MGKEMIEQPWWCFFGRIMDWKTELTTDESGRESLAKNTLFFGFIASTLFCAKLIIMGGFDSTFFGLYLAAFVTHSSINKWIDNKKSNGNN